MRNRSGLRMAPTGGKSGFTQTGFREQGRYRFMLMDIKRDVWEGLQGGDSG